MVREMQRDGGREKAITELNCASGTGFEGIKRSNVEIRKNAVQAVEDLCPNLQFWTFQTGGKVKHPRISNFCGG